MKCFVIDVWTSLDIDNEATYRWNGISRSRMPPIDSGENGRGCEFETETEPEIVLDTNGISLTEYHCMRHKARWWLVTLHHDTNQLLLITDMTLYRSASR
jgi:hypothetical protein